MTQLAEPRFFLGGVGVGGGPTLFFFKSFLFYWEKSYIQYIILTPLISNTNEYAARWSEAHVLPPKVTGFA